MASRLLVGLFALVSLAACSSAQKARQAEREKLSASTGMLCDFVNGDDYQDVEVELNLQMARRCDANKSFTISDYKNASEVHGVLFCCSMARKDKPAAHARSSARPSSQDDILDEEDAPKAAPKKETKKTEPPKASAKPSAEAPKAETKPADAPKAPAPEAAPAAPAAPSAPSASASPSPKSPARPAPQPRRPATPGDSMDDLLD